MPASGTGLILAILGAAVPVLGWVSVLLLGALSRPGGEDGEDGANEESEPVEGPSGRRGRPDVRRAP